MEPETRAEYQTLVVQVASWIMRARARNEYLPLDQLVREFVADVKGTIE